MKRRGLRWNDHGCFNNTFIAYRGASLTEPFVSLILWPRTEPIEPVRTAEYRNIPPPATPAPLQPPLKQLPPATYLQPPACSHVPPDTAILAIHMPLNTAYASVSTEPPDYNHVNGGLMVPNSGVVGRARQGLGFTALGSWSQSRVEAFRDYSRSQQAGTSLVSCP